MTRYLIAFLILCSTACADSFRGGLEGRNKYRFDHRVVLYVGFNGGPRDSYDNKPRPDFPGSGVADNSAPDHVGIGGISGDALDFEENNVDTITFLEGVDDTLLQFTIALFAKFEDSGETQGKALFSSRAGGAADQGVFNSVSPNISGTGNMLIQWQTRNPDTSREALYFNNLGAIGDALMHFHSFTRPLAGGTHESFFGEENNRSIAAPTTDESPMGQDYGPSPEVLHFGLQPNDGGGSTAMDGIMDEFWWIGFAMPMKDLMRIRMMGLVKSMRYN